MSVEQTEQLIQLILNSLLLMAICVIVLSSLLMRHSSVIQRFRMAQQEYLKVLTGGEVAELLRGKAAGDRLQQLKIQMRALRRHYRLTHVSLLTAHYALLFCIASTLVLALRAFIQANWLIHLALVLFVLGVVTLMISVSVTLFDLYTANHSVLAELNWILHRGRTEPGIVRVAGQKRSPTRRSTEQLRKRTVSI